MDLTKQYFKITDTLLPQVAAKKVYQVMSNPRHRKMKDFEEKALAKSDRHTVSFQGFDIQVYTWGQKTDKVVFLVHGWEGHSGNFGALIDILLEKGYYIVACDAPSHGNSTKGKTSMFDFAHLFSSLVKRYKPQTVISHSYGSVAAAFALKNNPDVSVDRWILVTTPHNFKDRIQDVIEYVGATERTTKRLIDIIEKDTGYKVDTLNMKEYGNNLNNVNDALIVHSKTDRILPIENARKTNADIPQSKLIELDGLGHYAILWSDQLKNIVSETLN